MDRSFSVTRSRMRDRRDPQGAEATMQPWETPETWSMEVWFTKMLQILPYRGHSTWNPKTHWCGCKGTGSKPPRDCLLGVHGIVCGGICLLEEDLEYLATPCPCRQCSLCTEISSILETKHDLCLDRKRPYFGSKTGVNQVG